MALGYFPAGTAHAGLVQSVTTFAGISTYGYDGAGRPTSRTDAATGLTTTRAYDDAGRVDVQQTTRGSQVVASFDLSHDRADNVVAKTVVLEGAPSSEQGTWTYAYDPAGRMSSATDPGGIATEYGYDGAGNRTTVKEGPAPAVTTSYDGAGSPVSSSDGTSLTTDATGALTKTCL